MNTSTLLFSLLGGGQHKLAPTEASSAFFAPRAGASARAGRITPAWRSAATRTRESILASRQMAESA